MPIFLYLRLEGPLQSWGDRSRFWHRRTQQFPTKSGVLGLLFCAMGRGGPQEEALRAFSSLPQTAYLVGPGGGRRAPVLSDFHMVGNGYNEKDPWELLCIPKTSEGKKAVNGGARLTRRDYLQGASFAVILGIPEEIADEVEQGLLSPVWDVYLGRKCCAPASALFGGLFDSEDEATSAVKEDLKRRGGNEPWVILEELRDAPDDAVNAIHLQDVPVRFGKKKVYRSRSVIWNSKEITYSFRKPLTT